MPTTTYLTDSEIEDFFRGIVPDCPDWSITNVPSIVRETAFSIVKERLQHVWETPITDTKVILVNGEGFDRIFVESPINGLDSIEIINPDETEVSLVLTGSNRQVYWDSTTGTISLRRNKGFEENQSMLEYSLDGFDGSVFPVGLENIRVTGQFGTAVPAVVKMIELLNIYKLLQFQQPDIYKKAGNLVREQIGRYEYQLGSLGFDKSSKNYSLDAYIDYLCELAPKNNSVDWGVV